MIFVDVCFADMTSVWCEQKFSYCCRMRGAIGMNMKVVDGDLELPYRLYDKLYTDLYLLRNGYHPTCIQKFESCQRTTSSNLAFFGVVQPGIVSRYSLESLSALRVCACLLTKSEGLLQILHTIAS